jgi:hypothetical protein
LFVTSDRWRNIYMCVLLRHQCPAILVAHVSEQLIEAHYNRSIAVP